MVLEVFSSIDDSMNAGCVVGLGSWIWGSLGHRLTEGCPCPQEERRVVFIGKIPSRMTRSELRHRFSVFGDIEECTLHFRSEG